MHNVERLVHGPLTALMMIETVQRLFRSRKQGMELCMFTYRAWNPLPVGRVCTIYGTWQNERTAELWATDGMTGTVVMTGTVDCKVRHI